MKSLKSIFLRDVMISSGKYTGPTQPQGKSYFKDEVYIRNADSGKGMSM